MPEAAVRAEKAPPLIWANVLMFVLTAAAALILVPLYGFTHGFTTKKSGHGFGSPFTDAISQKNGSRQAITIGDQHGRGSQTVGFLPQEVRTLDSDLGQERRATGANRTPVHSAFNAASG